MNGMYKLITLAMCVVAAACATVSKVPVGQANQRLNDRYADLVAARLASNPQAVEAARTSLRSLAEEASAAAGSNTDVLNRLALLRIATVAAWQGGASELVTYATSGQALCNKDGNAIRAPRDCGMLETVPIFAAVDETNESVSAAQRMPRATPAERSAVSAVANDLFDQYSSELELIFSVRPAIADSNADPALLTAIDGNTDRLLCHIVEIKAFGLIATVSDAPAALDAARCRIGDLKHQAGSAGLTMNELGCLETGVPAAECRAD